MRIKNTQSKGVSTALAIVAFFAGLKRIDSANASMIFTLEPVVTVALAVMVFGETMTRHKILNGMIILAAVLLLARRKANPKIS